MASDSAGGFAVDRGAIVQFELDGTRKRIHDVPRTDADTFRRGTKREEDGSWITEGREEVSTVSVSFPAEWPSR